jgi:hypothetical protein
VSRRHVLIPVLLVLLHAVPESVAQNLSHDYRSSYYPYGFAGTTKPAFIAGFSGLDAQSQAMPQHQSPQITQPSGNSNTMASLEQTLNAVDNRSAWARTPVSGAVRTQPSYQDRPQAPAPGGMANAMQGMFPGVTRQEMLRCFFEGGSPQVAGPGYGGNQPSANSSSNTSTAYTNYKTARNEEARARDDATTARYNRDKWTRKNAADRANYAANNAEYAAQRAESAAYSGDAQARNYAGLARQCANRARASANQARYNADTIR